MEINNNQIIIIILLILINAIYFIYTAKYRCILYHAYLYYILWFSSFFFQLPGQQSNSSSIFNSLKENTIEKWDAVLAVTKGL